MRNMSFMLTTPQIRAGTKDITRRDGWWFLKPGEILMACEQTQGLGKGGKIVRIRPIQIISTGGERLDAILSLPRRDGSKRTECDREGFPHLTPDQFVSMFCENMNVRRRKIINRIEFKYVDDGTVI